jgi:pimeloyl-ACP methyl ester carboxylesterase
LPGGQWNGDLVIFVHGYVSPFPAREPEIPLDQYVVKVGGVEVKDPDLVNQMGYAFATTSFRTNGLAVKDGTADLMELLGQFKDLHRLGKSSKVYLLGFSEGGLVTAKTIEKHQSQFAGGIAACGPIGDFKRQIDYFGDFRVLFDYFYPGILPSSPISIPSQLITGWNVITPTIASALDTSPISATQLISATQAAVDPADRAASIVSTTLDVLWYNVFATNDAASKLGGNTYGNVGRVYAGSLDDTRLNQKVQRFSASPAALSRLAAYQTSGRPGVPLVTLHTLGDDVIPYWHEELYREKVPPVWRFNLTQLVSPRYGHCNFTAQETQLALQTLVQQVAVPQRARVYLPAVRRP